MFTECPECGTTFRLSADDLRRAGGKVRCGNCHTVFNALESLAEDTVTGRAEPTSPWLTDSAANPPADFDSDLETDLDADLEADLESDRQADLEARLDNEAEIAAVAEHDDAAAYTYPHGIAEATGEPVEYEFDDEDDESGAILYTDPDDDEPVRADTAGDAEESQLDEPDVDADSEDNASLEDEDEDQNFPETDLEDSGAEDFDESIWERVPGIGALADAADDWQSEAEEVEADEVEADEWQSESAADADDPDSWSPEVGADAVVRDKDDDETEDNDTEHHDTVSPERELADETLEFDVPAEKWTNFFGPLQADEQASVWQPPQLSEADAASADTGAEAAGADDDEIPSWHDDKYTDEVAEPGKSRTGLLLLGGLLLAVVFLAQLVHYQRDALAAHPSYGELVRTTYAALGQELYPEWPLLDGYEIRGSEAVAGESGADVLDIRAQIAATGNYPAGLPRLRVVLRDRWSNPVAARDFAPDEYARAEDLPADGLLQPGAVIAAHVSILDPGSGAQGFELELCLPRRDVGLECTDQPFK